jgi:hypothetical protein
MRTTGCSALPMAVDLFVCLPLSLPPTASDDALLPEQQCVFVGDFDLHRRDNPLNAASWSTVYSYGPIHSRKRRASRGAS